VPTANQYLLSHTYLLFLLTWQQVAYVYCSVFWYVAVVQLVAFHFVTGLPFKKRFSVVVSKELLNSDG